jgi:hypothetical protein
MPGSTKDSKLEDKATSRDRVPGLRFSHQYVERGERLRDSPKARRRIFSLIMEIVGASNGKETYDEVKGNLKLELGLPVPSLERVLTDCDLGDFLDAISIIYGGFNNPRAQAVFCSNAQRIFAEEHLAYEIDDKGGVHPLIDGEFSQVTAAAIQALSIPRYAATLHHFETAIEDLGPTGQGAKASIRNVFLAAETLFKLVSPETPARLGGKELQAFGSLVQTRLGRDAVARNATAKMLASLADWVDAAHFYRHGQPEEQLSEPPLALTVLIVSQGAAFLRWLVSLDQTKS